MAANKVKFGLKNVHYALLTETDGAVTYGTPVPMPGAVSLTLDAQGDQETFYADDVAYYVTNANTGYQGNLELALIPDSFRKDVLGETEDETSHVLLENSSAEGKPFALLYQFAGDQKASLRVLYNCVAGRASENGSTTTNTKTPQTETLSITASPLADGSVKAKTTEETPENVRQGWFEQVWRPAASGGT